MPAFPDGYADAENDQFLQLRSFIFVQVGEVASIKMNLFLNMDANVHYKWEKMENTLELDKRLHPVDSIQKTVYGGQRKHRLPYDTVHRT